MVVAPVPGPTEETFNSIIARAGELYIVPSQAENVVGGMEFLRVLMSKASAQFFAENVGVIMPVEGGTEGVPLSPALESAITLVTAAQDDIFDYLFAGWYRTLMEETRDRTGDLLTGRITPEEWIDAVQARADEVAADETIVKYER